MRVRKAVRALRTPGTASCPESRAGQHAGGPHQRLQEGGRVCRWLLWSSEPSWGLALQGMLLLLLSPAECHLCTATQGLRFLSSPLEITVLSGLGLGRSPQARPPHGSEPCPPFSRVLGPLFPSGLAESCPCFSWSVRNRMVLGVRVDFDVFRSSGEKPTVRCVCSAGAGCRLKCRLCLRASRQET